MTLGPDYPHGVGLRVLLLPMSVEGDPTRHEDRAATEAMGQRLMEIGYRVIDWEQAKSRAAAAGVNLHSAN
ncbi:MAG TPA: hypothetical protein VFH43_09845, partial [Candidatus Kapabacteria bacterium]|nr:hypothetical protein [Candidatus Kapabacteria bacterium]